MKPVVLAMLVTLFGPAVVDGQMSENADPALERRLRAFAQGIRCVVCQNETLADSRAELANDLRREIREQMRAGRSEEEITAFLTDRYGDFVVYSPPWKSSTYLLWVGPFLLLGGGFVALYRSVERRKARGARVMSADERRRVRQVLRSFR